MRDATIQCVQLLKESVGQCRDVRRRNKQADAVRVCERERWTERGFETLFRRVENANTQRSHYAFTPATEGLARLPAQQSPSRLPCAEMPHGANQQITTGAN